MARPPAVVAQLARAAACAAGLSAALATAPAVAAPAPGRYDATLCVSSGSLAASCGPAEVDVRASGSVSVQVSDIVYRLRMRPPPALVVVTQGTMQIDEFEAGEGAAWSGSSLLFADAEKQVRYEVQVGSPRATAKR